ncbi:hypothetical protein FRD01_07595 [Microvenator marinus]|uniref:HTH luxR-type domain-containing protein n=1 Tax=Microvenator marinus TaxID=2600177 RepID=A0A5B8XTX0_9DELT|nr:helix-turn-helix transcriptional regulator [Microvenator marinus]QED27106.1 hypothetical protein FRD01_07595 [Microvenator marinus]
MTIRLVFGMLSEANNLERESMSERDNLSAILGSIYDSVGSENGWDEALLTITKSFDSVVSNVFLRPPDQELYLVDTIVGADPDGADAYREISHLDVRWPVSLQNIGKIINDVEVFQNGEYENSLVYNELFRQYEMRYSMTTVMPVGEGLVAGFALMRERVMGGYRPEEVQRLEGILPHLGRALSLQAKFNELERQVGDLSIAMEGLRTAAIILTEERKILCLNRKARRLLENGGLVSSRQTLRAERPGDTNALEAMIHHAVQEANGDFELGVGPTPVLTIARQGRQAIHVMAAPLRPKFSMRAAQTSARVMLLIYDPEQAVELEEDMVAALFGLTHTEAFVASKLAQGLSIEQVASLRRCSAATVRTHLKRVFSKTGVNRQSELVQLVLSSPAAL